MIGYTLYTATIACVGVCYVVFRQIQGKTWENCSVRNGIYVAKAAMLVAGKTGPLLYLCLITQIYYFSIVINHRNDS